MAAFIRAFVLSLFSVVILIAFALGISAVSSEAFESGFSSGEFFEFEHEENVFSAEIFGRRFSADFSDFEKVFSAARFFAVFLPVPAQLLIRLFGAFF